MPGSGTARSLGAVAALSLVSLAFLAGHAEAAPVYEHEPGSLTHLDYYAAPESGCYYNFQHYEEGDRIVTNEPCLNCTCHNRMLMCYLRVCPFSKGIGQDCTREKRPDQCCPVITCPEVPVQLVTSSTTELASSKPTHHHHHHRPSETEVGHPDNYGCTIDETFYTDGAQVPGNPSKPCELCYCIRNRTTCVMQECTLNVEGCLPVYQDGICCPVRYDCDIYDETTELETSSTAGPTTVRPTGGLIFTTTPAGTLDCRFEDEIYGDGAHITTIRPCEHCYCMKGDIVCAVQECGTPMEHVGKNCTALPPREGQCCPDQYLCEPEEGITTTIAPEGEIATTIAPEEEIATTISPEEEIATTFSPEEEIATTISSQDTLHGEPATPHPLESDNLLHGNHHIDSSDHEQNQQIATETVPNEITTLKPLDATLLPEENSSETQDTQQNISHDQETIDDKNESDKEQTINQEDTTGIHSLDDLSTTPETMHSSSTGSNSPVIDISEDHTPDNIITVTEHSLQDIIEKEKVTTPITNSESIKDDDQQNVTPTVSGLEKTTSEIDKSTPLLDDLEKTTISKEIEHITQEILISETTPTTESIDSNNISDVTDKHDLEKVTTTSDFESTTTLNKDQHAVITDIKLTTLSEDHEPTTVSYISSSDQPSESSSSDDSESTTLRKQDGPDSFTENPTDNETTKLSEKEDETSAPVHVEFTTLSNEETHEKATKLSENEAETSAPVQAEVTTLKSEEATKLTEDEVATSAPVQTEITTLKSEEATKLAEDEVSTSAPVQAEITTLKSEEATKLTEDEVATSAPEQAKITTLINDAATSAPVQAEITTLKSEEATKLAEDEVVTSSPVQVEITTLRSEETTTLTENEAETSAEITTPKSEDATKLTENEATTSVHVQAEITTLKSEDATKLTEDEAATSAPAQAEITTLRSDEATKLTENEAETSVPLQVEITTVRHEEATKLSNDEATTSAPVQVEITTLKSEEATKLTEDEAATSAPVQAEITTLRSEEASKLTENEGETSAPVQVEITTLRHEEATKLSDNEATTSAPVHVEITTLSHEESIKLSENEGNSSPEEVDSTTLRPEQEHEKTTKLIENEGETSTSVEVQSTTSRFEEHEKTTKLSENEGEILLATTLSSLDIETTKLPVRDTSAPIEIELTTQSHEETQDEATKLNENQSETSVTEVNESTTLSSEQVHDSITEITKLTENENEDDISVPIETESSTLSQVKEPEYFTKKPIGVETTTVSEETNKLTENKDATSSPADIELTTLVNEEHDFITNKPTNEINEVPEYEGSGHQHEDSGEKTTENIKLVTVTEQQIKLENPTTIKPHHEETSDGVSGENKDITTIANSAEDITISSIGIIHSEKPESFTREPIIEENQDNTTPKSPDSHEIELTTEKSNEEYVMDNKPMTTLSPEIISSEIPEMIHVTEHDSSITHELEPMSQVVDKDSEDNKNNVDNNNLENSYTTLTPNNEVSDKLDESSHESTENIVEVTKNPLDTSISNTEDEQNIIENQEQQKEHHEEHPLHVSSTNEPEDQNEIQTNINLEVDKQSPQNEATENPEIENHPIENEDKLTTLPESETHSSSTENLLEENYSTTNRDINKDHLSEEHTPETIHLEEQETTTISQGNELHTTEHHIQHIPHVKDEEKIEITSEGNQEIDNSQILGDVTTVKSEQEILQNTEQPDGSAVQNTENEVPSSTDSQEEINNQDQTKPVEELKDENDIYSTTKVPLENLTGGMSTDIYATEKPMKGPEGIIPGEGSCLIDGITYPNNSPVPSQDACHQGCHCRNSVIHCLLVECPPPPPKMHNCSPLKTQSNQCCPIYVCDENKKPILESENQMAATELYNNEEFSTINPTLSTHLNTNQESNEDTSNSNSIIDGEITTVISDETTTVKLTTTHTEHISTTISDEKHENDQHSEIIPITETNDLTTQHQFVTENGISTENIVSEESSENTQASSTENIKSDESTENSPEKITVTENGNNYEATTLRFDENEHDILDIDSHQHLSTVSDTPHPVYHHTSTLKPLEEEIEVTTQRLNVQTTYENHFSGEPTEVTTSNSSEKESSSANPEISFSSEDGIIANDHTEHSIAENESNENANGETITTSKTESYNLDHSTENPNYDEHITSPRVEIGDSEFTSPKVETIEDELQTISGMNEADETNIPTSPSPDKTEQLNSESSTLKDTSSESSSTFEDINLDLELTSPKIEVLETSQKPEPENDENINTSISESNDDQHSGDATTPIMEPNPETDKIPIIENKLETTSVKADVLSNEDELTTVKDYIDIQHEISSHKHENSETTTLKNESEIDDSEKTNSLTTEISINQDDTTPNSVYTSSVLNEELSSQNINEIEITTNKLQSDELTTKTNLINSEYENHEKSTQSPELSFTTILQDSEKTSDHADQETTSNKDKIEEKPENDLDVTTVKEDVDQAIIHLTSPLPGLPESDEQVTTIRSEQIDTDDSLQGPTQNEEIGNTETLSETNKTDEKTNNSSYTDSEQSAEITTLEPQKIEDLTVVTSTKVPEEPMTTALPESSEKIPILTNENNVDITKNEDKLTTSNPQVNKEPSFETTTIFNIIDVTEHNSEKDNLHQTSEDLEQPISTLKPIQVDNEITTEHPQYADGNSETTPESHISSENTETTPESHISSENMETTPESHTSSENTETTPESHISSENTESIEEITTLKSHSETTISTEYQTTHSNQEQTSIPEHESDYQHSITTESANQETHQTKIPENVQVTTEHSEQEITNTKFETTKLPQLSNDNENVESTTYISEDINITSESSVNVVQDEDNTSSSEDINVETTQTPNYTDGAALEVTSQKDDVLENGDHVTSHDLQIENQNITEDHKENGEAEQANISTDSPQINLDNNEVITTETSSDSSQSSLIENSLDNDEKISNESPTDSPQHEVSSEQSSQDQEDHKETSSEDHEETTTTSYQHITTTLSSNKPEFSDHPQTSQAPDVNLEVDHTKKPDVTELPETASELDEIATETNEELTSLTPESSSLSSEHEEQTSSEHSYTSSPTQDLGSSSESLHLTESDELSSQTTVSFHPDEITNELSSTQGSNLNEADIESSSTSTIINETDKEHQTENPITTELPQFVVTEDGILFTTPKPSIFENATSGLFSSTLSPTSSSYEEDLEQENEHEEEGYLPSEYGEGEGNEDAEQQAFGPGTCRYGGKVYVSAQQIPRNDPCDFCFCFRSDIICLQQSCPPPIKGCYEEPIDGFCCPRYECHVSMALSMNVSTPTTTTTTTLPPQFASHAVKGTAKRTGCLIRGRAYQVGQRIPSASGPCMNCICGADGQMQCDPKPCSPEPMLRQMIMAVPPSRR